MLLLIVLAVFFLSIYIGIGSVFCKGAIEQRFIIGVSLTLGYLFLIHLFFPINLLSALPPLLIGTYALSRRLLTRAQITELPFSLIAFASIGILSFSFAASFPISWYDTLLYHLPATKLLMYQHIIPGIGLLDERLAMISSTFYLSAFQMSLFSSLAIPTLLSLIYHLSLLYLLIISLIALKERKAEQKEYITLFAVILYAILHGTSLIATLAPETGIFLFSLLSIRLYLSKKPTQALLASTLALTTKSSGILIFFAILGLLLFVPRAKRVTITQVIPAVLLLVLYCLTSALQSGYAVFPVTQTRVPIYTQSSIPPRRVEEFRETVFSWARNPPNHPRDPNELRWFLSTFLATVPMIIKLGVVLGIFALIVRPGSEQALFSLLLGASLLSYAQAPDIRLLWPYVLLLSALGWTQIRSFRLIEPFVAILTLGALLSLRPYQLPLRRSQVLSPVPTQFNPQQARYDHALGFAHTMPQEGDDRCGVAEAPCLTYRERTTALRFFTDRQEKLTRIEW